MFELYSDLTINIHTTFIWEQGPFPIFKVIKLPHTRGYQRIIENS